MNSCDVPVDNEFEHDRKSLISAGYDPRPEIIGNTMCLVINYRGEDVRIKYRNGKRERL